MSNQLNIVANNVANLATNLSNVSSNAPLTANKSMQNASKQMTNLSMNLSKASSELMNNGVVTKKTIENISTTANKANLALVNASLQVNEAKEVMKNASQNAKANFNSVDAKNALGVMAASLNSEVKQITQANSIIKSSSASVDKALKQATKIFTAEGTVANLEKNSKGHYIVLENGSRRNITHVKTRGKLNIAPMKNARVNTGENHYSMGGNMKKVFKNKNSRKYVVQNGNIGSTKHYPFGPSKFLNSGEVMF